MLTGQWIGACIKYITIITLISIHDCSGANNMFDCYMKDSKTYETIQQLLVL
jgi:hypothetical protein